MQITIKKKIMPQIELTPNVRSLMRIFGLTTDDVRRPLMEFDLSLDIKPGQICFITGPSGTGKSVLLREIAAGFAAKDKLDINRIKLPETGALIDRFNSAPSGLKALSRMGLSDVSAMLLPPALLSEGQKYRYRLARAIESGRPVIVADEFCSALDKVTAGLLCLKLRHIADQTGLTFLLAGHSRGLMPDLLPDTIINVHSGGSVRLLYREEGTDIYGGL